MYVNELKLWRRLMENTEKYSDIPYSSFEDEVQQLQRRLAALNHRSSALGYASHKLCPEYSIRSNLANNDPLRIKIKALDAKKEVVDAAAKVLRAKITKMKNNRAKAQIRQGHGSSTSATGTILSSQVPKTFEFRKYGTKAKIIEIPNPYYLQIPLPLKTGQSTVQFAGDPATFDWTLNLFQYNEYKAVQQALARVGDKMSVMYARVWYKNKSKTKATVYFMMVDMENKIFWRNDLDKNEIRIAHAPDGFRIDRFMVSLKNNPNGLTDRLKAWLAKL